MIKLIAAIGPNNLIGNGNKMAWHIPEEFQHFKTTTMNSWLLMGANTYLGLPMILSGRKMCVVSPNKIDGVDHQVYNTKELIEFVEKFRNNEEVLFIAGGKSIYEKFYYLADELIISEVKTKAIGDVYLNWNLSSYHKQLVKETKDFNVYKYTKEQHAN